MLYAFKKLFGNLYAIQVEKKVYGVVLEYTIANIERGQAISYIYLLDENEQVIYKVGKRFGGVLKAFGEGIDVVDDMLSQLASEAKKITTIDFVNTFKAIGQDMKQGRART